MRPMTALSIERDWVPLENESLEFDPRQFIDGWSGVQSLVESQHDGRVRSHASYVQSGRENSED